MALTIWHDAVNGQGKFRMIARVFSLLSLTLQKGESMHSVSSRSGSHSPIGARE